MTENKVKRKRLREPLRSRIERGKEPTDVFGYKICRYCKTYIPKGRRRTFCSDECVHEHRLRSNIDYMKKNVYLRDKSICSACNLNCDLLKTEALRILEEKDRFAAAKLLLDLEFPTSRIKQFLNRKIQLWDADHIIPVHKGGGGCGLDGMRTLCAACHYKITKEQLKIEMMGYMEDTLW